MKLKTYRNIKRTIQTIIILNYTIIVIVYQNGINENTIYATVIGLLILFYPLLPVL